MLPHDIVQSSESDKVRSKKEKVSTLHDSQIRKCFIWYKVAEHRKQVS